MGVGNGQKAAMARKKAQKKNPKANSGGGRVKLPPPKEIKCMKCMKLFAHTTRRPELITHIENKHSKFTFDESFPNFVEYNKKAAEKAALAAAKAAKDSAPKTKKKKFKRKG